MTQSSLLKQPISPTEAYPEILTSLPSSAYSALVIDLAASAENYRRLSKRAATARCAAVLKADGYGVGAIPVGLALYQEGCRDFFVAYADEGVVLREALLSKGLDGKIYVLNGLFPGTEGVFTDHHLIPTLTDLGQVTRWQLHAKALGRVLPAALHVDTGMSRTGLTSQEVQTMVQSAHPLNGIGVELILSQMVYSHTENLVFSMQQRQRFEQALRVLPKAKRSLAKSGAIFVGQEYHYDMVRPGVALHGINPTNQETNPLVPVVSLWAKIYQIQDVGVGHSVGYAQTYISQQPTRVATLALGYADGYPWALANQGYVTIAGYQAPVIGRVSMDLLTVDVSHVPESLLMIGQWAQIIGGTITVEEIACQANTVPYEVLLRLGKRFQRVYTNFT
jgi:alanine racemase